MSSQNKPIRINYICGCTWEFVLVPFEHWRPLYCEIHQKYTKEAFENWNKEQIKSESDRLANAKKGE